MTTTRDSLAAPAAKLGVRASGILLHVTSLPGPHGSGDLGSGARQFVSFLVDAAQTYWQMLPVGPTGYGNSPYSAQSAFAGNPLLIALQPLVDARYLPRGELDRAPVFEEGRVDYAAVEQFRTRCLRAAFEAVKRGPDPDFARFCEAERAWLPDYALFRALKSAHGEVEWTRWEPELRDREAPALERASQRLADEIAFRSFEQWLFANQWHELRSFARTHGIALIGDIPIFLAHDSADVWQHRELFQLDELGRPRVVSGVPPDYFSATGQRWGNPLYDWTAVRRTGFRFWVERMRMMKARFDVVRIDHFIGFERYWEIPGSETTAVNGRWLEGPRDALFEALKRELGPLQLIAEDLGEVTPEVKALRDRWGMPGLRILQFAFGNDPSASDFLPHNYVRNTVAYTGTHDNDTTLGWFQAGEADSSVRSSDEIERERAETLAYLDADSGKDIHWKMIRAVLASVADTAIFPLQDVLGLDSRARLNRPGTSEGNWEWRVAAEALTPALAERLTTLTRTYERQRRSSTRQAS